MAERHRQHVMRHAELNHTTPPANPQRTIANSTRDVLDENSYAARRAAAGKQKPGKFAGAFAKLCDRVSEAMNGGSMTKSRPTAEPLRSEGSRMNDQAAVIKSVRSVPATTDLTKALAGKFEVAAKALGVASPMGDAPTGTSSLDATYNSDSATLVGGDALRKQSLDKRIQATVAPSLLTKAQVDRAARVGLAAGKLTGAQANTIATCLSIGRSIDDATMATLRLIHEASK